MKSYFIDEGVIVSSNGLRLCLYVPIRGIKMII